MSEKLMRAFEGKRNNPFTFRHLKLCHSISEVNKVPSPKVVLASTSDMECGFSRDLFAQWCVNKQNTIILTSRAADGTLAADLIKNGGDRNISLLTGKRVKLTGQELNGHGAEVSKADVSDIRIWLPNHCFRACLLKDAQNTMTSRYIAEW